MRTRTFNIRIEEMGVDTGGFYFATDVLMDKTIRMNVSDNYSIEDLLEHIVDDLFAEKGRNGKSISN